MCVLLFVVGHRLINHKCISKYDSIEDRSRWQLITFWFRSFTPLHSDWLGISYKFKLSYQYTITIHFFTTRQLKIAILVLNLKLNQSPPTPKTKRKRKKIMYLWSIFPHLPIWKTYMSGWDSTYVWHRSNTNIGPSVTDYVISYKYCHVLRKGTLHVFLL